MADPAARAAESPGLREAPGLDLLVDGPTAESVRDLLHQVIDPELGLDIVELGLLRSVCIREGVVEIRFTVTTPACPLSSYIEDEIRACLWQLPGVADLDVECVMEPAWTPEDMSDDARFALGWEP
jgi:metal-sulfur cluster biosynthetic enzyme